MGKGLWVVDETVTHMTAYRLATQAEIDTAASEQMRQDAAVGRALTVLVGSDIYSQLTLVISNHGGLYPGHKTYVALTAYKPGEPGISAKEPNVHAALEAAGLMEEENG